MRALVPGLVLMLPFLMQPAFAEVAYWLDNAIGQCRSLQKQQAALAASSTGDAHCVLGPGPLKDIQEQAVRFCTRGQLGQAKKLAPCQIVWQNGRIVAGSFYRAMTREFRVLVEIKSFDGAAKREVAYKGFMVAGKSTYSGTTYKNAARIVLTDGTEICRGWITPVGIGRIQNFEAKCLDNLTLRGKVTIKGLLKVDGYYRYAAFTATISNPPHKMTVWTP